MGGLTGLIAPVTSLRMLKGRLRLFISRSPISTACAYSPPAQQSSPKFLKFCQYYLYIKLCNTLQYSMLD